MIRACGHVWTAPASGKPTGHVTINALPPPNFVQGWRVSLMSESVAEAGGYKECVLQITGDRQVGLEFTGVRRGLSLPCRVHSKRTHET